MTEPVFNEMDEAERALAADCYAAVQAFSAGTDRAKQAMEFKVGVSDLGFCSERLRRTLVGMTPEHTDLLAAFAGTALGDYIERAYAKQHPSAIIQSEVTVVLKGERHEYHLTGHPDIVDPDLGLLIDVKTDRGLSVVRRTGPNQQKQFQRHGYALGAWQAGMFGDLPLEDVMVANVWMDRACDEHEFYAHMEPFDMRVVEAAAEWLDEVVYAWQHDQEARKEPPREVCAVTCGFFSTCRALDTDASGLLTDDEVVTAIDLYAEGQRLEKEGKALKDQAKGHLQGVAGSTGRHTIRWVWNNESLVPEHTRRGYHKIDVRQVK